MKYLQLTLSSAFKFLDWWDSLLHSNRVNYNDNDNDNEIHLFKPNFIYTIDNKYCL